MRRRRFTFRPWSVQPVSPSGIKPRGRSGHRLICADGVLTSVGGYNPQPLPASRQANPPQNPNGHLHLQRSTWSNESPIFRELWQFCFARRIWRSITADLPDHLASSAAIRLDNILMVFGGTGSPFGRRCSNTLYIFDLSQPNNGFNVVHTQGTPPAAQYGQAIIYFKGYLYVIGGTDGLLYSIDVHRLNLSTLTWETVFTCTGNTTDEPDARYRHELAFDGVNLYILAGGTAELAYNLIHIPVFSLETFAWSFRTAKQDSKAGYPVARKCHSAVQIKKDTGIEVFIMGGFDNTKIFNDIWRLDIPSLQWTQMKRSFFPNPLYFHSSAVTPEGCMYTFGGIQLGRENTSRTNKLYKLWLCIPKLSEICWESMLYYYPNMVNENRSLLLKSGIPVRFVERLDF